MVKKFSETERHLLNLFEVGKTFYFNEKKYVIENSGKPRSAKGEPKTDVYVSARDSLGKEKIELKISYKQSNADFLENKITAERAEEIFGENWKEIIKNSTLSIRKKFENKKLIFRDKYRNTQKGSITLGWRCEIVNKGTGELVDKLNLTKDQLIDVYSGTNLVCEKRNAMINGEIIPNSGVANYMLVGDILNLSTQEVVNKLISIEEYVKNSPELFFTFKALNYRSFAKKIEGNRSLAVQVIWSIENGSLKSNINFENPLEIKGNELRDRLLELLDTLNIKNTDDQLNVVDKNIVYSIDK
ncbi:hypothetical protein AALT52_07160 [Ligilactobacillus faecis]|uniref:Uncharacterized protein n=1 Tax=Ligilactobacillus faecis TaxID=762833 RepID=A0ABV4DQB6_9LACO